MKTVTSPENPLVKTIRGLHSSRSGHNRSLMVLEGVKLAEEALRGRVAIEEAVVSRGFRRSASGGALTRRIETASVPCVEVPDRLFSRLSCLDTPEGVLLLARRTSPPPDLSVGDFVLVLAGVQNPGNLGAMARVAEAAGVTAFVKCRGSADPFGPKALRASMGSLLRLPVVEGATAESTLAGLKEKGLALAGCVPRAGRDFREANLRSPLALVVGNESSGMGKALTERCDLLLSVPMKGAVESLNVAVVAALVLYEAARQREGL